MPASLLHRPHRPCAIIQAAGRRQQQQQRPPRQPAATPPPPLGRRRLLSVLPMPLLWLQWRGCDQGGAYSTGVGGEPGKDCQVRRQREPGNMTRGLRQRRCALHHLTAVMRLASSTAGNLPARLRSRAAICRAAASDSGSGSGTADAAAAGSTAGGGERPGGGCYGAQGAGGIRSRGSTAGAGAAHGRRRGRCLAEPGVND